MVRERVRDAARTETFYPIPTAQGADFDIPVSLGRNGKPVIKLTRLLEGLQAALALTQFRDEETGRFKDATGYRNNLNVNLMAKHRYQPYDPARLLCRADDTLMASLCWGHHQLSTQKTGNGTIQQLFNAQAQRCAVMVECVATVTRCYIGFDAGSSTNYFTLGLNERIIFEHTDLNVYFYGIATDTVVGTEWFL